MTNDRDDGFFTLEAIVALAISALVLVSYFQATIYAHKGTAQSRLREELLATGQSEIASAVVGTAQNQLLREGAGINGIKWSLRSEPIAARGHSVDVQPVWVVFEALDAQGRTILELRTINIIHRSQ